MTTVAEAMAQLDAYARELHGLSHTLAAVEKEFAPVQEAYEQFMDDFDTGLWFRHETEGAKLPPEAIRLRLAHMKMAPELLGSYRGLKNKRERLRQRIRDVKADVEGQRSILSALKVEMEASR